MNVKVLFICGVLTFVISLLLLLYEYIRCNKKNIFLSILTCFGVLLMTPISICALLPKQETKTIMSLTMMNYDYTTPLENKIIVYVDDNGRITPKAIYYKNIFIYKNSPETYLEEIKVEQSFLCFTLTNVSYNLYLNSF